MDERIKRICERLTEDGGTMIIDSEYAECGDCGMHLPHLAGHPSHTTECIITLAEQLLEEDVR